MGKTTFHPESQLSKHGWTSGSGLGRKEDGIKEAVKVKLKFDQAGVGHDVAEQFTYHWWDHAFNKAAKNITVDNTDDGDVKLTSSGECKVSAKKGNVAKIDQKMLLYGSFVKAGTLNDGIEMKHDASGKDVNSLNGWSEDSSSEEDEDIGTASKLSDEQLMQVCGGRTAHKAARHGLGLSGKLARIAEQEQLYTTSPVPSPKGKSSTAGEDSGGDLELNGGCDGALEKKDKKKKKKKKRKLGDIDLEESCKDTKDEHDVDDSDVAEPVRKKKKSKKSKKKKHKQSL